MDYCDRSPCDLLLWALGRCVFGDPARGTVTIITHEIGGGARPVGIRYCPFCGTRLDNLMLVASGEVFLLPEEEKVPDG